MDLEGGLDCNFGKFYQSNKRTTVIIVSFFVFDFFKETRHLGSFVTQTFKILAKNFKEVMKKIKNLEISQKEF